VHWPFTVITLYLPVNPPELLACDLDGIGVMLACFVTPLLPVCMEAATREALWLTWLVGISHQLCQ